MRYFFIFFLSVFSAITLAGAENETPTSGGRGHGGFRGGRGGGMFEQLRNKYPKEMAEIEKLRSSNPEQSREKMRELMRKAAPEMGMRRGFRGGHGAGERPVTDLEPTPEQLEMLKNKYPAEFAEYEKLKNSDKPEEKTLAAGKLKAIIKKAMAENPALLQGKFLRDRNRRAVNFTRRELKRRYPEKMREIEEIEKTDPDTARRELRKLFAESNLQMPGGARELNYEYVDPKLNQPQHRGGFGGPFGGGRMGFPGMWNWRR